jgi:predicted O-linked N-acetylglucosamine transferase (SPINDLY family)
MAKPYGDWANTPDPNRRLRIGFVSGDLRSHSVGKFIENVFASLASQMADKIELWAYYAFFHEDQVTGRIRAHCTGWLTSGGLSDEALAQRIHNDGIDILIDLSGHTGLNRLPMFAWKPAPVQATWLGYLATTGVPAIDYLIADDWTLPPAEECHFTERIVRMPESYLCFTPPQDAPPVAPPPALSKGHITFGSFNNLSKVNDAVLALWARILAALPNSHLLLKTAQLADQSVRNRLTAFFTQRGITADRLELLGLAPQDQHLPTYHQVDIALDPFPYPGITTSVEALWMGVPIISLAGQSFMSRQGVGILNHAALPNWIAHSEDDYLAKAIAFSADLNQLATIRSGLRQSLLASPLFDHHRFALHFEATLRSIWQQWCKDCGETCLR